jgi:UDP:flavonoid glycosyltransferase YjiC (YdhE family)
MAHDQPDKAARVEQLGLGLSLSPKKSNAATLAEKIGILITSKAILDRCKAYAQRIDPDQALNETSAVIEAFADAS